MMIFWRTIFQNGPAVAWSRGLPATVAPPEIPRDLPTLTALRGIAALTVLIFHINDGFRGYLAVDLFFLLSGFVLMHVYGRMAVTRRGYLRFLQIRLARIYPIHLLTLLLLLPMLDTRPDFSLGALINSLLLLQSPWGSASWNYGAWSISAEWHAYLLFPLLAAGYCNRSNKSLLLTLLACGVATIMLYQVAGSGNVTNSPVVLLRCLPEFVAGMTLYCLWQRGVFHWLGHDAAFLIVVLALVAAETAGAPEILVLICLALLLLCSAGNRGYFARGLNSPMPQYLGYISYSLYMVQMVATVVSLQLFPKESAGYDLLFVGLSFALAAVISPTVEYPARDWLKRLAYRGMTSRLAEASPVLVPAHQRSGDGANTSLL